MFVIGTASTEEGLQLVRDQGADLVFNHKNEGYMNEIAVSLNNKKIDFKIVVFCFCDIECD